MGMSFENIGHLLLARVHINRKLEVGGKLELEPRHCVMGRGLRRRHLPVSVLMTFTLGY